MRGGRCIYKKLKKMNLFVAGQVRPGVNDHVSGGVRLAFRGHYIGRQKFLQGRTGGERAAQRLHVEVGTRRAGIPHVFLHGLQLILHI